MRPPREHRTRALPWARSQVWKSGPCRAGCGRPSRRGRRERSGAVRWRRGWRSWACSGARCSGSGPRGAKWANSVRAGRKAESSGAPRAWPDERCRPCSPSRARGWARRGATSRHPKAAGRRSSRASPDSTKAERRTRRRTSRATATATPSCPSSHAAALHRPRSRGRGRAGRDRGGEARGGSSLAGSCELRTEGHRKSGTAAERPPNGLDGARRRFYAPGDLPRRHLREGHRIGGRSPA